MYVVAMSLMVKEIKKESVVSVVQPTEESEYGMLSMMKGTEYRTMVHDAVDPSQLSVHDTVVDLVSGSVYSRMTRCHRRASQSRVRPTEPSLTFIILHHGVCCDAGSVDTRETVNKTESGKMTSSSNWTLAM